MILHVDMDAFFASIEMLDNPDLSDKCVIVGGLSDRGVVATANYAARRRGVHSAMPMVEARRRCPDGIFLRPRKKRYAAVSKRVMDILAKFSPAVEQVSIDEAYLDISGSERLFGTPVETGRKIKEEIRTDIGITCSVGIAPLKFLAKIASDMQKPDGLTFIEPADVSGFIDGLPVEKVPGVGPATRSVLYGMGIKTLADVKSYPQDILKRRLGRFGRRLYALSMGNDESRIRPVRPVKSISQEETLDSDTMDIQTLRRFLLKQAESVGRTLRKENRFASTVFIKLKYHDFSQITRQSHLPQTRATEALFDAAEKLLLKCDITKPVRLIGMGVSGLDAAKKPRQMSLFGDPESRCNQWEKLDHTVDEILDRFGDKAVQKAGLLDL